MESSLTGNENTESVHDITSQFRFISKIWYVQFTEKVYISFAVNLLKNDKNIMRNIKKVE